MKSLQTIQKTFRVFQTLSKIAMILSFVWAGLAALGLLCGVVWYFGGNVFGVNQELLYSLTVTGGLTEMIGVLLVDMILALTDGTLLVFARCAISKRSRQKVRPLPSVEQTEFYILAFLPSFCLWWQRFFRPSCANS